MNLSFQLYFTINFLDWRHIFWGGGWLTLKLCIFCSDADLVCFKTKSFHTGITGGEKNISTEILRIKRIRDVIFQLEFFYFRFLTLIYAAVGYMILTVGMAFSPKVPMYKNNETVCIPSLKYCLYICICFWIYETIMLS